MTDPTAPAPTGQPGAGLPEPVGYAEAMHELEAILTDLERGDLDVDRLAGQVRRAQQLITYCRERITQARLQIEQVVATDG